jgi:hypothetical protein
MGDDMCQFKSSPKEIEYSNEDKVNFYISTFFFKSYFAQFFLFLQIC